MNDITFDAADEGKEVFLMQQKAPQGQSPPKPAYHVPPEARAWLDCINGQLAYDERMQVKRERWLAERPANRNGSRRRMTRNEREKAIY